MLFNRILTGVKLHDISWCKFKVGLMMGIDLTYKRRIFNGFTLAEVIITLGIIGIVAAMTMPILMTKLRERTAHAQLKTAYSKVYQAIKIAQDEGGYNCFYDAQGMAGGGYHDGCPEFFDKVAQHLKVSRVCKGNAYADGCIPKYKGIDDVALDKNPDVDVTTLPIYSGCSYYRTSNILTKSWVYVLLDGTILIMYGPASNPLFAIDVNGKSGPNRWGYDVYGFIIRETANGSLILSGGAGDGGCLPIEVGGKSVQQIMKTF